jgi:hypothetical protein
VVVVLVGDVAPARAQGMAVVPVVYVEPCARLAGAEH